MTNADFRTLAGIAKRAGADYMTIGISDTAEEIVSRHPEARSYRCVYMGTKTMIQSSEVNVDGIRIEATCWSVPATEDELAHIAADSHAAIIHSRRPEPEIEPGESEPGPYEPHADDLDWGALGEL